MEGSQGFISEFNAITGNIIWSTTVAGPTTYFLGCAIDNNHNLIVVGDDFRKDPSTIFGCSPQEDGPGVQFPQLTMCNPGNGAYFQILPGRDDVTINPVTYPDYNYDGIIMRFSNEGVLSYSTYFGGEKDESIADVAVDLFNNIWVIGTTDSYVSLPCTTSYCVPSYGGCEGTFPLCNNTGNSNTYFERGLNLGPQNGNDAFIVKLDADLNLELSTYYGGEGNDFGTSIACSYFGEIYIAGTTANPPSDGVCGAANLTHGLPICFATGEYNQPTNGGGTALPPTDDFIARFSNDGELMWATLWGAYGNEGGYPKLAIDYRDNVYLVGKSSSPEAQGTSDIFTVNSPVMSYNQGYNEDAWHGGVYNIPEGYISCFSRWNNPIWSTFFGGRGVDRCKGVAASDAGYLYVCGVTDAQYWFPTNVTGTQCCSGANAGSKDGFIAQFGIGALIDVDEISPNFFNLTIYPVPTQNLLNIDFTSPIGQDYDLKIFNLLGAEILYSKISALAGQNSYQISTNKFTSGMYFVKLDSKKSSASIKFIKE